MTDARSYERGQGMGFRIHINLKLYHIFLQQSIGDMSELNAIFTPGMRARHPDHPEWGTGQVQSNIGGKITVNFPEEGKVVIDGSRVTLVPVFDD